MKLTTNGFIVFKETNADREKRLAKKNKKIIEHTCTPPNDLIKRMFRWHLRQHLTLDSSLSSTDLILKKMRGLNQYQKQEIGTLKENRDYLTHLASNKKNLHSKSSKLTTLTITPPMQITHEKDQFLLFDTDQDENYRIICFSTKKNLMKLLEADQWLADANF